MKLVHNTNYFLTAPANIINNDNLREPQIEAYEHVYQHFIEKNKKNIHAIVVLPTGVGKTGLIGILPFGISEGRVLVITPQIVIKDAVLDSLDPLYPGNFWLNRGVFSRPSQLPKVIEYDSSQYKSKWFQEALEVSNFVVLNVHKLQKRLSSSLLNIVDRDFFDMIIIDEAHHSTANTWVEAIRYFSNAKVVKLTGTPFRADKEEITGELVYKYKLSAAMAKGYVKSLEKFTYVPDKLYLTIDENDNKKYTVEEIYEMGLKDEEWVSRSVAYSLECSEKVVDESIKKLEEKLDNNKKIPHKIIAVACSINHANDIKMLYESKGYPCAIVHSKMTNEEKEKNLKDIENHRVKVVINVAMLGEGYDHPYLSVAAIFRPFRSALPYAQFIGRILRKIPDDEVTSLDNIGQVISHQFLYLDELWEYYKNQIQESEVIKHLSEDEELANIIDEYSFEENGQRKYDKSIGKAEEVGVGSLVRDVYLETELIKKRKKEIEKEKQKLEKLKQILNISEEKAKELLNIAISDNDIKRPDIYFKKRSKNIDNRIKYEIVPELILRFGLKKEGNELKNCIIFKERRFSWILERGKDNASYLAIYINCMLAFMLGKKEKWGFDDIEIAEKKLDEIKEYLIKVLDDYTMLK